MVVESEIIEYDNGVKFVKMTIGKDVENPFKDVLFSQYRAGVSDKEFVLYFGLDNALAALHSEGISVVEKMVELAVLEPVSKADVVFIDCESLPFQSEFDHRFKLVLNHMIPFPNDRIDPKSFLSQLDDNHNLPVIIALPGNKYIGRFWETDGDSYVIYSDIDSSLKQFASDGQTFAKTTCTASYDLFGTMNSPGSYVALMTKWKSSSVSRAVSLPALQPEEACLLVRGVKFDPSRIPKDGAALPDASLRVLHLLEKFQPSNPIASEQLVVSSSWTQCIDSFVESASQGLAHGGHRAVTKESRVRDSVFKQRTGLDFTEEFWDSVILQATSMKEMFYATRTVIKLIFSKEMVPFVHKTNTTLMGDVKLQSGRHDIEWDRFLEAMRQDLIDVNTQAQLCQILLDLGRWKLQRDYVSWVQALGVQNTIVNADFATLVHLRNCMQVANMALSLRCPHTQVASLFKNCLTNASMKSQEEHHSNSIYAIRIPGELPWVKDDANGINPLPPPKIWQSVQSTHDEGIVHVTRITPMDCNGLSNGSMTLNAARQILQMLESNPTFEVRNFISREYQEIRDPTYSKNTTIAMKSSNVSLL